MESDLKLPNFAAIEFHDAILDGVNWQQGSGVTLVFSHMAVYFSAGEERYEVWSCRASLKAAEVTRLEICGSITDKDWVSDGELCDQLGNRMDLADLKTEKAISKMELVFTNSAAVVLHAAKTRLIDISRTEFLEWWIGPLQGA